MVLVRVSAPQSSSSLAMRWWPSLVAWCSGVQPDWLTWLTLAPASSSSCTMSRRWSVICAQSLLMIANKQDANVSESTNKRPFLSRVARSWGWRVCARRRTRRGRARSRRGRWSAAGRPAAAAPAPAPGCRRDRRSGTPSSCRPAPAG